MYSERRSGHSGEDSIVLNQFDTNNAPIGDIHIGSDGFFVLSEADIQKIQSSSEPDQALISLIKRMIDYIGVTNITHPSIVSSKIHQGMLSQLEKLSSSGYIDGLIGIVMITKEAIIKCDEKLNI